MKLRTHITLSLLPLLILFILLVIYTTTSLVRLESSLDSEIQELKKVQRWENDIVDLLSLANDVLVQADPLEKNPSLEKLKNLNSDLKAKFTALPISEIRGIKDSGVNLFSSIYLYLLKLDQSLEDMDTNPEAFNTYLNEIHSSTNGMVLELAQHYHMLSLDIIQKSDNVAESARRMVFVLTFSLLLGLLGTLFAVRHLNRLLIMPIFSLEKRMASVANKNLDIPSDNHVAHEVNKLEDAFQYMVGRLKFFRKLTDKRLVQISYTFRSVMEQSPNPIIFLDAKGDVFYRNRAAIVILQAKSKAGLPSEVKKVLQNRELEDSLLIDDPDDAIPITVNGGTRYYLLNWFHLNLSGFSEIEGESEDQMGEAFLFQDVTMARLSNDLKTNLLETVSHELKTPLTSARLALYLLAGKDLGELNKNQLDLVVSSKQDLDRLLTTIQNLLELSRIKSRQSGEDLHVINLNSIVRHSIISMDEVADADSIKIELSNPSEREYEIFGNESELLAVLKNFLANALKHSVTDSTIDVVMSSHDEKCRVEVIDHGEGMPKEMEQKVFDKYSHASEIAQAGGGIGLDIAKEIIEKQNGEIGCCCELGKGCTFFFELPLHQQT